MIRHDMTQAEYRAAPGYSNTFLKAVLARNVGWALADREPSQAMTDGDALHAAVFEPDRFASEFVVQPDDLVLTIDDAKRIVGPSPGGHSKWRLQDWIDAATAAGGVSLADWQNANPGRAVISDKTRDEVVRVAEVVRAHPIVAPLLSDGAAEVSCLTDDFPHEGVAGKVTVAAKCRPDWLSVFGAVIDLKKTVDASATAFGRQAAALRYHLQGAFYGDIVQHLSGVEQAFVFVAVESDEKNSHIDPRDRVAVYVMPPDAVDAGRGLYREAIDKHIRARAEKWNGYPKEDQWLQLPYWALHKDR